ncbi:hypothetical protein [Mesorhizobium sp. AR02]|uniref:hypothetical protein n=1 Tax=Mesorhizobium sp. AR02 TaxID=2865837 RepID=UPI003A5C7711
MAAFSVMDAIKQADGTAENIASIILEAKIDTIKVPNFIASHKAKILYRYTLANTAKGIDGTLLLDKEEEGVRAKVRAWVGKTSDRRGVSGHMRYDW